MAKIGKKTSGVYYLDVLIPNDEGGTKRSRVSCDTRDPVEAERQRREWEVGMHPKHFSRGAVVVPKGKEPDRDASVRRKAPVGVTMGKLLDMCHCDRRCWAEAKSQATIRSNIKLLSERFGGELVSSMTHKRLCALADEMLDEGYSPGAVKRKMDMVSKALRMAAEVYEDADGRPLIAAKPTMPRIKVRNNKNRVLRPEEELMVFAAMDARIVKEPSRQWQRFAMFIRVLIDTGFRRGEALILGPDSVVSLRVEGQEQPFLALPEYQTKSDKPRMVPATPTVAALFDQLNAQAVNGRWFPLAASAWYMWSNVRDDVKAMGGNIDDVGLHTLRHTCITRLALGGMELQRLSMWAGHADVSITASRYSHLSAQALFGGVAILSNPANADNSDAIPDKSALRNYSVNGGNRDTAGTVTVQ